jgi:carbon monoxide dehydrogenase subunit G
MPTVSGTIDIARPVNEVFDFVADERNEPRYNEEMVRCEKVTPGSIEVGTRYEAELRTRFGIMSMTIEVTGFERPRRLASWSHMDTMDIRGSITFEPIPEGTRMAWEWKLQPHGCMRMLGPLVGRMGRSQEQRIWTSLKALLESKSRAPVTAA